MNRTGATPSVCLFFLLVFLFAVPVYALRLVAPQSAVLVVIPITAASFLTWREKGLAGVKTLVFRAADYRRISKKIWYLPIVLLMPAVMLLNYGWMSLRGNPVPGLQFPLLMEPVFFLVFFIMAIGEEAGWSGYALDPLRERFGALKAAIVIGTAWAAWHLVPYALANAPLWVAGQCATTVLLRVLMVWISTNTGRSVFGMVLFHAMINLCTVPDYGIPYDPVFTGMVLAVVTAAVVIRSGPDLVTNRPI